MSKGLQVIVGENVRQRRLALHYSQERLAEVSGLHRTYIGAIERGERNVTVDTLSRLATALDCSVISLFE